MEILSTTNDYYKKPSTVRIGNINYKDVTQAEKIVYKEDNLTHELYTLNTKDAEYWAHTADGKLKTSMKYYWKPVKRTFDGREYSNIISNDLLENGNKLYKRISIYGFAKDLLVSPDNHVINNKKTGVFDLLEMNLEKIIKYLKKH